MFIHRLRTEYFHFLKLTHGAQKLLISCFFMSAAYSIIGTFINAYVYRINSNIYFSILYTLGRFCGITLAFFLNGFLLKRFNIKRLYFMSSLFMGIAAVGVVFSVGIGILLFFMYGIILGIGEGFHWSNRNYLALSETDHTNRTYFTAINFSTDAFISIIISFSVGWLIVLGLNYQILMGFAFILLFSAGLIVLTSQYPSPQINSVTIFTPTKRWQIVRLLQFGMGVTEGILFFFTGFLILTSLGNESTLGMLSAATTLISSLAIYVYGRKSKSHHEMSHLRVTVIMGFAISLLMAVIFNKTTILLYNLFIGPILYFMWLNMSPITMNVIDLEVGRDEDRRYSHIFDSELFLFFGRLISLTLCFGLVYLSGQTFSLRFTSIILYAFQAVLIFAVGNKLQNSP